MLVSLVSLFIFDVLGFMCYPESVFALKPDLILTVCIVFDSILILCLDDIINN